MHAIYPGSFDPLHNGHLDLIRRASRLFEKLTVAVLDNPLKPAKLFSANERLELIRASLQGLDNVEVETFSGLLVTYLKQKQVQLVLKGLRSASDFDYESQMAQMNRYLSAEFETVFLLSDPQWAFVSSSRIREVSSLGASVSGLVPNVVEKALKRKFRL